MRASVHAHMNSQRPSSLETTQLPSRAKSYFILVKVQKKCKSKGSTYSRLTPPLRVAIYYMSFCGVTNTDIASAVVKPGGGSPSLTVVADTIAYASKNGGRRWDGILPSGAGRPRSTTGTLDKAIQRVVFKRRGSVKVTQFVRFFRRGL